MGRARCESSGRMAVRTVAFPRFLEDLQWLAAPGTLGGRLSARVGGVAHREQPQRAHQPGGRAELVGPKPVAVVKILVHRSFFTHSFQSWLKQFHRPVALLHCCTG